MILTGRARESFEEYFIEHHEDEQYPVLRPEVKLLEAFNQVPLSMQLGVYIDWFDSVDIRILIVLNDKMNFTYSINGKLSEKKEGYVKRNDARIAALGKATFLYNSGNQKKD